MSFLDKAKARAEEIIGDIKDKVGEATGNKALELSGEAEADAARERDEEIEREERKDRGDDPGDESGQPAYR